MEWAKETAKGATDAATRTAKDPKGAANAAYATVTDTANSAYGRASNPGETAAETVDTAADYTPDTGEKGSSVVSSVLNTPPFNSFKPDPSTVWKAHFIYFLLSAGCSISWWTFVTAADYFMLLYPGTHIIRFFTLAYFVAWLIVYVLSTKFARETTSWVKINVGVTIAIVSLVLIPFMDGVFISGERGTTATFWVTLVAVALAGAADAVSQGSLQGIAVELPDSLTHVYVSGASASGVFVFVVRVITKASLNSSTAGVRISAIIYFSIAAFFLVLVLALFAYIHSMPAMGYYNSMNLGSFETVRLLIQDEATVTIEVASGAAIAAVAAGRSSPAQPLYWKPVVDRVKLLVVAVVITSIVSLAIFPGHLTEDIHSPFFRSWYPVLLVGTYIVCDLVGRLFTAYSVPQRQSSIFGASWVRLILVGFYVLSFLEIGTGGVLLTFLLTALLGLSNGLLIASLTILFPQSNPSSDAESAGILQSLIMTIGFIIGAGLSWIWIV